MEQQHSSQLPDSSPHHGARHPPARHVDRGETASTTRGDKNNEIAAQPGSSLDGPRLLRFPAMQKRVSMGRTAVYELIKAGKFPRPVKVGSASAWIDLEITRWIEDLAAERKNSK